MREGGKERGRKRMSEVRERERFPSYRRQSERGMFKQEYPGDDKGQSSVQ